MRKLYTLLFTLIVLLSTTMSVQAFEYKSLSRNNDASASASWTEINNNATTNTYLSIYETDDGTDIYVSQYTYDNSEPYYWYSSSYKSGCLFTKDNVFKIDKKLNSASLSEVKIDLNDWNAGETETVTLKVDWTGEGDISTGSYKSSSTYDDYVSKSSSSSSHRQASATGSINDSDLGTSSYASMGFSESVYSSMDK